MVYEWKEGAPFTADPQKVMSDLERLGKFPSPRDVLDLAVQKPKSELHRCFEWDDTLAGIKYRLGQARRVLGALILVEEAEVAGESQVIKVQAYESYVEPQSSVYHPVRVHVKTMDGLPDVDIRQRVLTDIQKQITQLERKAAKYASLGEGLEEMQKILKRARFECEKEIQHLHVS